jgi:protein-L-isoaspartate(D-aspartate) O-methyltransferase
VGPGESIEQARQRMVERQLAMRGIADRRVQQAFRDVPREQFVAAAQREAAYDDGPLPIGQGQTISQPYIVALTCEALQLRGTERVLEIGTGSGYAAAILARLAAEVFSVERLPELAELARQRLSTLGYSTVAVRCGDGTLGWPEHAPYDAIAVAAGGPTVPQALIEQLKIGGRLVIPVGDDEGAQVLTRITRVAVEELRTEQLADVRFVPLIGAQGWVERAPQV